jgi:hypothetical protein
MIRGELSKWKRAFFNDSLPAAVIAQLYRKGLISPAKPDATRAGWRVSLAVNLPFLRYTTCPF